MVSYVALQVHRHCGWVLGPWHITQSHSVSARVSIAVSALHFVLPGTSVIPRVQAACFCCVCTICPVRLCQPVPGPLWSI